MVPSALCVLSFKRKENKKQMAGQPARRRSAMQLSEKSGWGGRRAGHRHTHRDRKGERGLSVVSFPKWLSTAKAGLG